ncbi:uncharacterized protein [Procambarus clarkii]|uniref:uncharacterized protein isoform X1 n=2 Tax=Procambarus clarkii TaxID=6728 RepID=UPI003742F14E
MRTLLLVVFPVGLVLLLVTQRASGALWPLRTFIVRDMTFPQGTAITNTTNTTSVCGCKMRCLALPNCAAFAAQTLDAETFLCRLTNQSPQEASPTSQPGVVYGYKLAQLKNTVTEDNDGTVYFGTCQQNDDFNSAKTYCKSIPGFRLAILRNQQQINFAKTISSEKYLRIDLQKSQTGTFVWGDQTMLTLTANVRTYQDGSTGPNGAHYSISVYGIYVSWYTGNCYLCQGNDADNAW